MQSFGKWLNENFPQGTITPGTEDDEELGIKRPWSPPALRGNPSRPASVDPHLLRNVPQPEPEPDMDLYDPLEGESDAPSPEVIDQFNDQDPFGTYDDPPESTFGGKGEEDYYRNQKKIELDYQRQVAFQQMPVIAKQLAARNALSSDVKEAKRQMYKAAKEAGLNPKAAKMILKAGPWALRFMTNAGVTPAVRYS